jgi:hypothetical protein
LLNAGQHVDRTEIFKKYWKFMTPRPEPKWTPEYTRDVEEVLRQLRIDLAKEAIDVADVLDLEELGLAATFNGAPIEELIDIYNASQHERVMASESSVAKLKPQQRKISMRKSLVS